MNYQNILNEIADEIKPYLKEGNVADYIPALKSVNPNDFAMSITLFDGTTYNIGDFSKLFSIQSLSKVFTFSLALKIYRTNLYKRVGREPSGDPFNSLVQLEHENGIPRNPFINAGAIVITDSLISKFKSYDLTYKEILNLIKELSGNETIDYDDNVYQSEKANGSRNLAVGNFMKSFGNLDNDTQDVVNTYFKHCSIEMNTTDLSRSMLFLANDGVDPLRNIEIVNELQAKRINSVMLTCGHYDASGDFAYRVGLPGKSGVGGGIVAIVPNLMAIAVYSPGLNKQGNSLAGTKALELFTNKTSLSIF